jgi:hypothetical protein
MTDNDVQNCFNESWKFWKRYKDLDMVPGTEIWNEVISDAGELVEKYPFDMMKHKIKDIIDVLDEINRPNK